MRHLFAYGLPGSDDRAVGADIRRFVMNRRLPTDAAWIALSVVALLTISLAAPALATMVTYPAVPGMATSGDFTVEAEGKEVWVENYRNLHVANFSCSPGAPIKITAKSGSISSFAIRPKSKKIPAKKDGASLTFTVPTPQNLWIDINGKILLLFANPLEVNPPKGNVSGMRYYGPGKHNVGLIKEGIYIAGGAIVYGWVEASGSAKVMGRGILDGTPVTQHATPVVKMDKGSGGILEGIIIRNAPWFAVIPSASDKFTIDNIKILNNVKDGIDPMGCKNLTIRNTFIRSADDAISIKQFPGNPTASNILVEKCVLAGYSYGDGLTIGFEIKVGGVQGVTMRDCDVLTAVGNNGVGGHSAMSVICDGAGYVSDVVFDDVRVEEKVTKNFELNITKGNIYPRFGTGVGGIQNITVRNVHWVEDKGIYLKGQDASHQVENVRFENCTVAGKPLKGKGDAKFTVNSFVKGLAFEYDAGTTALHGLRVAPDDGAHRRLMVVLGGTGALAGRLPDLELPHMRFLPDGRRMMELAPAASPRLFR